MAYQGWIQLHRKILASDIWPQDRSYTDTELFLYLIIKANHADGYPDWYGERILVRRGQHLTSILMLAEITNHDRKWVDRTITKFTKMGMLKVEKRPNRFTLITICNYNTYNPLLEADTTTLAPTDTATDAPQTTMINHVNKYYSGRPEKGRHRTPDQEEYYGKIDLITAAVHDHLGLECSGGQAGHILQIAGREHVGDAVVAVRLCMGKLTGGKDFVGLVDYQLKNRGKWNDKDLCEAKAITSKYNDRLKNKFGLKITTARR